MKSYAVIFTYSFDSEVVVYLFDTVEEAREFLASSYREEMRIDIEENGWDSVGSIDESGDYASITTTFYSGDTDITEMRVGNVYGK